MATRVPSRRATINLNRRDGASASFDYHLKENRGATAAAMM
jgi:hypothetical protein